MYGAMLDVRASIMHKARSRSPRRSPSACSTASCVSRASGHRSAPPRTHRVRTVVEPQEMAVWSTAQQRLLLPWLGWCTLHFTGQRFRDSCQRFARRRDRSAGRSSHGVFGAQGPDYPASERRNRDHPQTLRRARVLALSGLPEISNNYLACAPSKVPRRCWSRRRRGTCVPGASIASAKRRLSSSSSSSSVWWNFRRWRPICFRPAWFRRWRCLLLLVGG